MGETGETKYKLLIVEDDFENQKFLKIFLSKYFNIEICDSLNSAIETSKNKDFDIFLVDISLRGYGNGLDFIRYLKSQNKYIEKPVICISAHVFPEDKKSAMIAGASNFIARPIKNSLLLKILMESLKKAS